MIEKKELLCHTTERLNTLVTLLKKYKAVADIGCDHAYLAILLAREGVKMICSDITEGPIKKARENIKRFGLEGEIDLRMGDGLSTIDPSEAQAIVVAGMGGAVISGILEKGKAVAEKSELYLQPMSADTDLRKYLYEAGYSILEEVLVKEDRRVYTIIHAKKGEKMEYTALDLHMSPALRGSKDPLLGDYIQRKKRIIGRIIDSVKTTGNTELIKDFENLYNMLSNLEDKK